MPPMGEVNPGVKVEDVLADAYDDFVFTYADMDKCGDMEDHAYYAGRVDGLFELLWNYTNTKNPATGLARKTSSIIGDTSTTYHVLENHMNEQTAVDIAEAILPETETVAKTVQSLPLFATGVAVGVAAVSGAAYLVYRKKKAAKTVVVADPTV